MHGKAQIETAKRKTTSAFQFRILMFLWLCLKNFALLDWLVDIKMFEKRGKTNDWQLQEASSALEHSCVSLQIAFFVKHMHLECMARTKEDFS